MTSEPLSSTHTNASLAEQCRNLPAPVRRYLEASLGSEVRPIVSVTLEQTGMLRTDPGSARWVRFDAHQRVDPLRREFDWTARVRLAPLIHLRVRDAYAAGEGQGQVHLWSWLKLAAERDVPELNAGALHRYLAEAPWYPSSLLPFAGVHWSTIGESDALATLEDRGTTVSLEFRFNRDDEVESIHTPGRWRRVNGAYQRCAWEGHFSEYRSQRGLRIPLRAEVGWHSGGRLELVWRGEVTGIEHHFGPVDS